jgi:hypothetical protein
LYYNSLIIKIIENAFSNCCKQRDSHADTFREAWRRLFPTRKRVKEEAKRSQNFINSNKVKKKTTPVTGLGSPSNIF